MIEGHSGIVLDNAKPGETGRQIVALSALLPSAADPLWIECSQWEAAFGQICPSKASPTGLLTQIDQEFTELAPVLKVSAPRKSLVESYQEVVVPA